MHNLYRRSPLGLALLCLFASHPLTAQSQATADTVVVTASRFPERALDAPIGTRIITAAEIRNSTASTLSEVLRKLGGVHALDDSGSPDAILDLRGFGITGDDNTLVLLDGVRIERIDMTKRYLSSVPLQMVDRIEILPGSGAVLYGAGATGGTINIITKSGGQKERSLTLFGGAGTHNTKEARVIGRVGGEELGLTLSGTHYRSDNYRDNNDIEQTSGMGDLTWRRGNNRAALRFGADRQMLGLPGPRSEAQLHSDRKGATTPDDHSLIESGFVTLSGGTQFGTVELEGDVAYRDGKNDAHYVRMGSAFHSKHDTLSISPRMRWNTSLFDRPLQLISGIDWYRWNWEVESIGSYESASKAEQDSTAFYIQAAADLTESTRLNLGWRAQRIETEQRTVPPSFITAKVDEQKTLYASELGLRQQFSRAWSGHVKTGRSFRVPNVDENYGFEFTGVLLKPQTSRQNEVGLEYAVPGMRAAVVAYDMKLDNEIALMVTPPGFFANTNLAPTRRKGLELSAAWQPTQNLDLRARFQWQRATFRKGEYGGFDVSGNEVPLVPRRLASLYATWEFMPRTALSANYTYVGQQRYDNDQSNTYGSRIPSYDLVDLRLSRELGNWSLALNVNNVFDKEYYNYAVVNQTFTSFSAYPQVGRTYFVSAEYRFQ